MNEHKPQVVQVQAKEQADETRSTGWIRGWTLSSQPETLLDVAGLPLGIQCLEEPGRFQLELSGFREPWTLMVHQPVATQTVATGLRMVEERENGDRTVSVVKLDAQTLLAEGDEELLGASLDPDAEWTPADAHILLQYGGQFLVWYLRRASTQSRLVITTGAGEAASLLARARQLANTSAHALVDQAISIRKDRRAAGRYAIDPLDWLRSRLRAATPVINYPWLADDEDEPLWRLDFLYPAYLALLEEEPSIAAGLVSNVVESLSADGTPPVAGGHASPVFHQPGAPLLVQMVMDYHRGQGGWPMPVEQLAPSLERYMTAMTRHVQTAEIAADRWFRLHWLREASAWNQFIDLAAVTPARIRLAEPVKPDNTPHPADARPDPFADLLDPASDPAQRSSASQRLNSLATSPEAASAPEVIVGMFFVLHDGDEWEPGSFARWTEAWHGWSREQWQAASGQLLERPGSGHERLLTAGFCVWTEPERQQEKIRQHRISGWFKRRRRLLWVVGLIPLAALLVFVTTVLLRPSMPSTLYETRMGMALRSYQSGHYAEAEQMLREISERGHGRNPINLYLLGKNLFQNGQYKEAAEAFERVIEVEPEHPAAFFNLGLSQFHAGDIQAATKTFRMTEEKFASTYPQIASRAGRALRLIGSMESPDGDR